MSTGMLYAACVDFRKHYISSEFSLLVKEDVFDHELDTRKVFFFIAKTICKFTCLTFSRVQ